MVEYGTTRTMTGPVTGTRDVCLSLREETNFEIRAVANNDVDLTMSVESEYELGSNDDSNGGRNPYLNLGLLPPGTYRVRVGAYNSSSWTADFDLITDRLLGTDDAAAGEAIYLGTCAACHGADATGIDGLGKDLHANTFIIENSNGAMLAFLRVGRPASDPDNDTGVDMPPQGGNPSLSDQDLQNVVAYLRTLQ
jgi:disulfide bond formation protein DsbB